MENRAYSLAAGISLLCAALVFLAIPELLDYDAFFPFIFSLAAFVSGVAILVSGLTRQR